MNDKQLLRQELDNERQEPLEQLQGCSKGLNPFLEAIGYAIWFGG